MRMVSILSYQVLKNLLEYNTILQCICFQAFDQQQQDLVDAASKALSYRQDIIEENIRLTYALQVIYIANIISL